LLYSRCKSAVSNLGFSLLEKAYAKLYGCYALIKDLTLEKCLTDLTNTCLIEQIDLTRLVKEQKTAHQNKINMSTILKIIKRTNHTKSICMAIQQPMRTDLYKIILNCNDNLKKITFNSVTNTEDLIGWDKS